MTFVTINDRRVLAEWDEGGLFWVAGPPPLCACGESLGQNCDPASRKASVTHERLDVAFVTCDACGKEWPIEEARAQGDGWSR